MKKLFLLLIFIPLVSFGQDINKESNGYTEVVEVKLTKKEIHQKINEWIAVNYKSAQDVIQLNTEDRVIAKGNFTVNFRYMEVTFTYRIHNSLTFSIRDNKYKIDLVPNRVSLDINSTDVDSSFLTQYISSTLSTKDEFIEYQEKVARNLYSKMGYSEKKTQKWINKLSSTWEDMYSNYLLDKPVWDDEIKSTFQSIKDYVSKSNNEDW
jgi:hypothetical protein